MKDSSKMSNNTKKGNKMLKYGLILQSLAPLFFLTFIKNFDCDIFYGDISKYIFNHKFLLSVLFICVLWVVISGIVYLRFRRHSTYGLTEGYTIKNISKQNDKGLEFFLTLIIPLIMDDMEKKRDVFIFMLIIIALCVLLSKTNLYYSNPVLIIMGYNIIDFEFEEPPSDDFKGTMVGIIPPTVSINEKHSIKFKSIADNVLYVRQKRRENK